MRLWLIWIVLAVIWALQAGAALVVHRGRAGFVMSALAGFFAVIGLIVRRRTLEAAPLPAKRKARLRR